MTKPILGLTGYIGAGKSTAAEYLADKYGYQRPHPLAPGKAMLAALLRHIGYDHFDIHDFLEGAKKQALVPELGVTSRYLQESLGTNWGRECLDHDIWLRLWLLNAKDGPLIMESVRFENEALEIRKRRGYIIEIKRPGHGKQTGHVSDVIPCEPDYTIWNDSADLNILYARLDGLMDRFARLDANKTLVDA